MAPIRIASHPAFTPPREELRDYFSQGEGFLKFQTHLSFVCGANGDTASDGSPSLRAEFLSYLRANPKPNLLPVLAEVALEELSKEPDEPHVNLNEFEELIAQSVDSVVIFPESPGSFSELGMFSGIPELANKTLVASHVQHQRSSFITLGPIHHLSTTSQYKPLIIGQDHSGAFQQIIERLIGNPGNTGKRRKRYEHNDLKTLSPRAQLAVLAELIAVCSVLTEQDFKELLAYIFRKYDISRVRKQLALLVAMGLIRRSDASDIIAVPNAEPLIDFDIDTRIALKGKWTNAYRGTNEPLLDLAHHVLNER